LFAEADRRGQHALPIAAALFGGTMLDERVLIRAEDEFGILIMRAYGSSEAPVTSATRREEPVAIRTRDDGRPMEGVEVRIGSQSNPSECCVRGPHLFLGYVDEADNQASFESGWFCTGDVASFDGGRLRITGRIKDIVIRNGLNISLAHVEVLVSALPGVDRCVAYGVPDDATGEHLAVAVRPVSGAEVSLESLTGALAEAGMTRWMLPEQVVVWNEAFPTTATGKVKRDVVAECAGQMRRLLAPRLQTTESQ
jgi:acyl-CoA synthetase (AMP-forming)/AMP-acid ligase II